jgi:hypothetical protein
MVQRLDINSMMTSSRLNTDLTNSWLNEIESFALIQQQLIASREDYVERGEVHSCDYYPTAARG